MAGAFRAEAPTEITMDLYLSIQQLLSGVAAVEEVRYRFSDGPIGTKPEIYLYLEYLKTLEEVEDADGKIYPDVEEIGEFSCSQMFVSPNVAKDLCDTIWGILSFTNKCIDEDMVGGFRKIILQVRVGKSKIIHGYHYNQEEDEG